VTSIIEKINTVISNLDEEILRSYENDIEKVQEKIVQYLQRKENFSQLTNNYPIEFIRPIVSNHLYSIKEALLIKDPKATFDYILWELNTYYNMTLPFNFFQELFGTIDEILQEMNNTQYTFFIKLYKHFIEHFEELIKLASSYEKGIETSCNNKEIYESFLEALLEPNMAKAITISNNFIQNKNDIKTFWEDIIVPTMHTVGFQWSKGIISVGQEHTATSICQRVMALHYDKIISENDTSKKVLVTPSPKELHQIGARMVSDFLELHNYDVFYFTPESSSDQIIDTIKEENIKDIIISTTLVSNLSATRKFIEKLHQEFEEKNINIYVGGQAYTSIEHAKSVKADHYISDVNKLLESLEKSQDVEI